MTVSVEEWRGVAAETTDDVPARLSMLLRKRTRRLLGRPTPACTPKSLSQGKRPMRSLK